MRVRKEEIHLLESENIKLLATNRGAILKSLESKGKPLTRKLKDGETKPGEKGALFCAPIVFGRIKDRNLIFQSQSYTMPYPDDLDAESIDPDHLYIHGIHHYYTYETEKADSTSVSYLLEKSRLPKNYPFPHSCRVSYTLEGNSDLIISVEVFDTEVPTPAMLTVHPFFVYKQDEGSVIEFKGKLLKRFDYDTSKTLPQPESPPTQLENDGPFSDWTTLDTTLDHSFISADGVSEIRWGKDLHLLMKDESRSIKNHYPLQIWTSGGHTRNACGIEQGGPANLFYLVENKIVPAEYLPVVKPGEIKDRTIRYTVL